MKNIAVTASIIGAVGLFAFMPANIVLADADICSKPQPPEYKDDPNFTIQPKILDNPIGSVITVSYKSQKAGGFGFQVGVRDTFVSAESSSPDATLQNPEGDISTGGDVRFIYWHGTKLNSIGNYEDIPAGTTFTAQIKVNSNINSTYLQPYTGAWDHVVVWSDFAKQVWFCIPAVAAIQTPQSQPPPTIQPPNKSQPVAKIIQIKDVRTNAPIKIEYARPDKWYTAYEGMDLFIGDKLRTDGNTVAAIEFVIGGRVGINKNSVIEVVGEGTVKADSKPTVKRIVIKQGGMWAKVAKRTDPLEIQTNGGVIGIRG